MDMREIVLWKEDWAHHIHKELLPFWIERCFDPVNGGFITQYDAHGNPTDYNEKPMLAHMRTLFSLSLAVQYGHDADGRCADLAKKRL